jgi:SMODS-associating 2TM, beta-strand rich effector domain
VKRAITTRVVVAVVLIVFVAGTWMQDGTLNLSWLKFFSIAVLIASLVLMLWDLWLWRIPLIQMIPGVPRHVGGTWKGTLTTFWEDPRTGNRPVPKSAYLVIRQTASSTSVKLLTNESRSASTLAAISALDGTVELTYLYLNRPDARYEDGSRMHHGSAALVVSGESPRRLKGRYWTDRDSKGELDFDQRHKDLADDFDQAAKLFS